MNPENRYQNPNPEEVEMATRNRESERSPEVSIAEAKEILGGNYLGVEATEKVFGTKIEEIPDLPFSRERLEDAQGMDMALIFRVDTAGDKPLTIENMCGLFREEDNEKGYFVQGSNTERKDSDESFFKELSPRPGWALVGKDGFKKFSSGNDLISEGGGYLAQTLEIVDYMEEQIKKFGAGDVPPEFTEAIKEFKEKKYELYELSKSQNSDDQRKLAQTLVELRANQVAMHNPAEVVYDAILFIEDEKKREPIPIGGKPVSRFSFKEVSTASLDSDGFLVSVGISGKNELSFMKSTPKNSIASIPLSLRQ